MFALSGEKDDGGSAAAFDCFAQQFDPIAGAEPIIDQTDIVLVFDHGAEALIEIGDPIDLKAGAFHLVEKAARQDVIVLVVLNQQNF